MKYTITFIFIFFLGSAQGQNFTFTGDKSGKHYQKSYNQTQQSAIASSLQQVKRNERCNGGLRTIGNLDGCDPAKYYNISIGTSYHNILLPPPDNMADRLRFIRLDNGGVTLNNVGYEFTDSNGKAFHSSGNSISGIKNDACDGGYVAVGTVASNSRTGAVAAGGSDILFTRLGGARDTVLSAINIDINSGGRDTAWCIRKSVTLWKNQQTWILCGQSTKGTRTDCFVARVTASGTIVWSRRYNFDPGGTPFNSAHCIARQLCEDAAGNIYVVGTLQDITIGTSGIDGLAFKLNSAGTVLWAYSYHSYTDDRFQAVRFTGDGNLIVGGFTNYGGRYNMLIVKLTTSGGLLFRNMLRANEGGVISPGKAYDIIEVPSVLGVQYYLAGALITSSGNYEMLYHANASGVGVNWNRYQKMKFDVGFGLDFNPRVPRETEFMPPLHCAGVVYFSSMLHSATYSDSHIMKTDMSTATCNFSEIKTPNTLLKVPMTRNTLPSYAISSGTRSMLKWVPFYYQTNPICEKNDLTGCTAPVASITVSSPVMEQQVTEAGKLHITPNPVAGTLRMQFRSLPAGEYQVSVTDMEGKLVLQGKKVYNNGSSLAALDVSFLKPGVYLLRAGNGTLLLHQKMVKQ